MKIKLVAATIVMATAAGAMAGLTWSATEYTLIVNGKMVGADIREIDGTTYVPLRAVSEILDKEVGLDNETKTITIRDKSEEDGVYYTAGSFMFKQPEVRQSNSGYELTVEVSNKGEHVDAVIFTASFFDRTGKRIGTAKGSAVDLDTADMKVVQLLTDDDLQEFSSVRFQIDTTG